MKKLNFKDLFDRAIHCSFTRDEEPAFISSIFKISLEKLWQRHEGEPVFFQIAIDYLRRKGLGESRIFRDAPNDTEPYDQFINLCEEDNINEIQQENGEYAPSPVVVAWFLRNFLQNLPTPLIPNHYDISKRLLDAVDVKIPEVYKQSDPLQLENDDPNEGILDELSYIKSLIISLKPEYHHILRAMTALFHDICVHQQEDGFEALDPHHLAQIFGPIFIGLKDDSKVLHLSQDLVLFLINHYHDIFERNTFKELIHIHRTNQKLERVQNEQSQSIRKLNRTRNHLCDKLSAQWYESRLKSRLFLSWRSEIPRSLSERKQYIKLQSLTNSLEISKQIIERQSKRIQALETKMELNNFDRRLSDASAPLASILEQQSRRQSASHVIGGSIDMNLDEQLRQSISEIVSLRQYDDALIRNTSYKSLFETKYTASSQSLTNTFTAN